MGTRKQLNPINVIAGGRTPFIKSFGMLKALQADDLGIVVLKDLIKQLSQSGLKIDEVVEGNVVTPINASNIARVIALKSGLPESTIAHTVSRNCASGMESIVAAWHAIEEGRSQTIAAGGTESMTNVPMILSQEYQDWLILGRRQKGFDSFKHLLSFRPRFLTPISALKVGFTDPVCGLNMGETAEKLAVEFKIRREQQDEFARQSHIKASAAWDRGFFDSEVIAVQTSSNTVSRDNGIRAMQSESALANLKPVFKDGGTVTAGNSSQISDGASSLILCSDEALNGIQQQPLGRVRGYAISGLDPSRMGLGPVYAIHQLLTQSGMNLSQFDLFEINEAFAAQVLACLVAMNSKEFCQTELKSKTVLGEIPLDRLNVNGGAIALGHPLGASGNRIVLTLLHALRERKLRHGLAAMCIGGGQGMAMWVESNS